MRTILSKFRLPLPRRKSKDRLFWHSFAFNALFFFLSTYFYMEVKVHQESTNLQRQVAESNRRLNAYFAAVEAQKLAQLKKEEVEVMRQLGCLAEALYYESKPFDEADMIGNAHTIINRTHTAGFPDTICEVVQQVSDGGTYQFSYHEFQNTLDKVKKKTAYSKAGANWKFAKLTAARVFTYINFGKFGVTESLFYHTTWLKPYWLVDVTNCRMKPLGQIGAHLHYGLNNPKEKALCVANNKQEAQIAQIKAPAKKPEAKGNKIVQVKADSSLAFAPIPKLRPNL